MFGMIKKKNMMNTWHRRQLIYVSSTTLYGGIRKAVQLQHAYVDHFDTKHRNTQAVIKQLPMQPSSKVFITFISAFACLYFWPIYMLHDLHILRKKQPRYVHAIDYMFL